MKVPLEIDIPAATININMPTDMPLMCDVDRAAELFGVSKTTLNALRRLHPDIPVRKIGRDVRFLVPEMYAWFRDYPGGKIPTE